MDALRELDTNKLINVLGLATVVYLGYRRLTASQYVSLPLPPGPPRKPVIGNMLDIPTDKQWLRYHEWCQQYGDVIFLEALGQKIIVLDSLEAVNDLMEKRSAAYSDRPGSNMIKLMDMGWLLSMMPYGERWRQGRRLLHQYIHSGMMPEYDPLQLQRAQVFAKELMKTPDHISERSRESFGGTVMKLVYGIDIKGKDDPYVYAAEDCLNSLNEAAIPGKFLVDVFGWMKYIPGWFPGAGFQRFATHGRTTHVKMRADPISVVRESMASGTAPPSIVQRMYDGLDDPNDKQSEQLISDIAGISYIAGMDTTVAAIVAFFLGLVVEPEVQRRAQAELDAVVGPDRLPTFEDRARMPYIEGIVNEAYRWIPVLPLSVPHATTTDNEYRGFLIPKGSIVMGNAWAILHDADAYPEPERFKPERYLKKGPDGSLVWDDSVRDPRVACFGFGRRICPGRWLADNSLWATIATCLATITVSRSKDANGNEEIPVVDVTSGLLSHAKPFPYAITPRSRRAEELVAHALS